MYLLAAVLRLGAAPDLNHVLQSAAVSTPQQPHTKGTALLSQQGIAERGLQTSERGFRQAQREQLYVHENAQFGTCPEVTMQEGREDTLHVTPLNRAMEQDGDLVLGCGLFCQTP